MSKNYRKFVAGTVTAAVVASAIAPAASAAASFSDVPADHQFAEAINALAAEGTFIGKDGKFDIYGELTRRQAAVVFARLIEGEGELEQVFSDVPLTDAELTKAAYEVNEAGVMTGADGKLNPYSKLTRQQMAKIIVEHFDLTHVEGSDVEIKDLDKAHESQREYIQILAENGITQVADGNFRPTETVKRGQFAAFVYRAMNLAEEPVVEQTVESVASITTTGVEVVLPKVTEAKEGFAIEVVDPSGNTHEVKAVNLEIGETEATFEFVTPLNEVELGIWTVGGVEFDTEAVDAVNQVNDAANQVELLDALNSSYFEDVNEDLIVEYKAALDAAEDAKKDSVEEIQDIINKVNEDSQTAEEQAEILEAVNEAKNQVELLDALQDSGFKRVNADWIVSYDAAITAAETSVEEIQNKIDAANLTAVGTAIADATDELTLSKVTDARSLVNSYVKDDVEGEAEVKAPLLETLAKHEAVVNVSLATTNAKLDNALKQLAAVDGDNFEYETVNALELTNYRNAVKAAAVNAKDTAAEIQTIVNTANVAAETAAAQAFANVTADTTTAQLKELFTTLDNRSEFVAGAFDGTLVNDQLLEQYRTAIVASAAKGTATEIQAIVTTVNAPEAALNSIAAATTADQLLTALKDKTLNFTNVVDANKDAYYNEVVAFQGEVDTTDATTTAASVTAVKKFVDAVNAKVALNAATTASAAKAAVTNFAIVTDNTAYINASSTVKLEVAELVLANKGTNGYAATTDVTAAIAAQMAVQAELVADVNAATTISAVDAALEALEYDAYDNLTAAEQLDAAEAFLNAFPVDAEGAKVDYTTLTAIKADLDKAIASVN